jgi:hypothetical protein
MIQGFVIALLVAASLLGLVWGLPFWYFVLLIPTAAYGQLYAANQYMFRKSIDFEQIPAGKFNRQLAQLEENQQKLAELGFVKFDQFLFRTSTDIIIYIYQHQTEPIYLCNYHFGQFEFADLITNFEDDFTLTTANAKNAGIVPRSDEKMLQVFDGRPIEELAYYHHQSIQFLESQGFTTEPTEPEAFRHFFLKSYFETGKKLKGFTAPAKLIYWLLSGVNKRYGKTIQQQYLAKQLSLSE